MNEFDIDLRLDEDFLFILNFSKDYMNVFVGHEEENTLAQQWLSKLCCEVVDGITAKRLRNTYLVRLISCLQAGKLTEPFDVPPVPGPLPAVAMMDTGDREPPWLNELVQEAKDQQATGVQAKDGRTYLASKVFENNKGACAYLAVSVADEGKGPAWIQLGTEDEFEGHLDKIFSRISAPPGQQVVEEQGHPPYDKEFTEFLVNAMVYEATRITQPGDNPVIEKALERFSMVIRGTPLGAEAEKLSGPKLRDFLFMHLQSQLFNDMKQWS